MYSNYPTNDGYGQRFPEYGNSNFRPRGRARGPYNPRGNRPPRGRGFQPNFQARNSNVHYNDPYQDQNEYSGPHDDNHMTDRHHYEYDANNTTGFEQAPEYAESYKTHGSQDQWNQDAGYTDYQQTDVHMKQTEEVANANVTPCSDCQQEFDSYELYQMHVCCSPVPVSEHAEEATKQDCDMRIQLTVQINNKQPGPSTQKTEENKQIGLSTQKIEENKRPGPSTQKAEEKKEKVEVKKEEEEDESSDEEDTGFCKYCNQKFPSARAYHAHIRGMQHTTLVMEAKAKQGDKRFQKEVVAPEVLKTAIRPPQPVQEKTFTTQPLYSVGREAGKNQGEADESDDSEEEDTGYCKYCKITFTSAKAYHAHTRGIQHTALIMEAKAKQGDKRFQKEIVAPEVLETVIPAPRPYMPEAEEEEGEEDWGDMESEVVDYVKKKRKIEERDLDFEELGKKPDNYNCPLCEIFCTGPAAFKSHLEGKSHKYKLQMAEQGALVRKKKVTEKVVVVSHGRQTKLSELIKDNPAPMLGLNYLTEIQQTDFKQIARYVCNLCESKMDQYAIVNHLVGTRHRLKYMKAEKPDIYDHLTKYNSKRKKSEINAACEEFAIECEKKDGRGQVKVKIQLEEDEEDKANLQEDMQKAAIELRNKVYKLEKGDFSATDDDKKAKKPKLSEGKGRGWGKSDEPEPRFEGRGRGRGRDQPWDREFDRDPYWERERDFYRGPDPYDPYHHRRMEFDYMDERRLYDERRYLDSQMMDRHRLDDPYLERRRIDDIMDRKRDLEIFEQDRINRVIEMRKQMEESDPDTLRLKRYELRHGGSSKSETFSNDPAANTDANYRPSFEEIQARRRQTTEIAEKLLERPKLGSGLLPGSYRAPAPPLPPPSSQPPLPPPMLQPQLPPVQVEERVAQRVMSSKAVQEEAARNPGVNVSELLSKLSSSMIASEDEAAMALQISSALTQALLSYRLQKNPSDMLSNFLEQPKEPAAPSIPGLDGSSSENKVPYFLKTSTTPAQVDYNPYNDAQSYYGQTGLTTAQSNYPEIQTGYSVPQTDYSAPQASYSVAQTGYPPVAQTGLPTSSIYDANGSDLYGSLSQAVSYAQASLPMYANAAHQAVPHVSRQSRVSSANPLVSYQNPPPPTVSISYPISQAGPMTTPSPAPPVTPSSYPAAVSQTETTIANVSVNKLVKNRDQPQKQILESIRKQTELLKKKIELATAGRPVSEILASQNTTMTSSTVSNPGAGYDSQQKSSKRNYRRN